MKTNNKLCLSFLIGLLVLPIVPTSLVLAGEEQRAPPEARTAGTLGPAVMRAISEIQEMMQPEDPDDERRWIAALEGISAPVSLTSEMDLSTSYGSLVVC